jgi:uncharacterized protein (TIGR02246 family)
MTAARLGIASAVVLAALTVPGQTKAPLPALEQRRAIEQLLSRFLRAFENLDMTTFISCFAEDATVFFPAPEPPRRFDGKPAIEAHFEQVFAAIRKTSASSHPPYHRLKPEDLLVQLLSPEAAVVTLHLRNTERIGRRTLVLKKTGGTWLIAHLHASNIPAVTTELNPKKAHVNR